MGLLLALGCGDPQADSEILSDADLANPSVTDSPAAVLVHHVNLVLSENLDALMTQYDPAGVLVMNPSGTEVSSVWTLDDVRAHMTRIFGDCDFTQTADYEVFTQNIRVSPFATPSGYADITDVQVEADGPHSMGYCPKYDGDADYQYHLDDPAWSYLMRYVEPGGYRIRGMMDGFHL